MQRLGKEGVPASRRSDPGLTGSTLDTLNVTLRRPRWPGWTSAPSSWGPEPIRHAGSLLCDGDQHFDHKTPAGSHLAEHQQRDLLYKGRWTAPPRRCVPAGSSGATRGAAHRRPTRPPEIFLPSPDEARSDSLPDLEIDADDVKCSPRRHRGAAGCGGASFYLMSRCSGPDPGRATGWCWASWVRVLGGSPWGEWPPRSPGDRGRSWAHHGLSGHRSWAAEAELAEGRCWVWKTGGRAVWCWPGWRERFYALLEPLFPRRLPLHGRRAAGDHPASACTMGAQFDVCTGEGEAVPAVRGVPVYPVEIGDDAHHAAASMSPATALIPLRGGVLPGAPSPPSAGGTEAAPWCTWDNAATNRKPEVVLDAIVPLLPERQRQRLTGGIHELSRRATDAFEAARATMARFLGAAGSRSEVIWTTGLPRGETDHLIAS